MLRSLKYLALGLVLASCGFLAAQTQPATSSRPTSQPTPPSIGLSGPGAPFSTTAPVYRRRAVANAAAVRNQLIPPIVPILDLHIRDTIIRLGPDGNYYLTGSVGDDIWKRADGIELWRSADLKRWDYLGVVWSFAKDATWEKPKNFRGVMVQSIWAPEIIYIKSQNTYFLTFSMPPGDRGLLKSTTGKPEGPYVNALANDGKLEGGIDLNLFEDDDGKVYATWGPCLMARMKDDLSGLAEAERSPVLLDPDRDPTHHATNCPPARNCNDIGHEGPSLFKRDGKYYMTGADTYQGRYSSMVAIADNVYGPYKWRHEAVPCGGGTNYFEDKEGNWWCAYFGNDGQSPFREMAAMVRIDFDKDGRIFVADEQPAFILQENTPTKWRRTPRTTTAASAPATRPAATQP